MLLEETLKYVVESENSAKTIIEQARELAHEKGYTIKKAGYVYKTKKSKGEIIDEVWVVTITQTYGDIWEDRN